MVEVSVPLPLPLPPWIVVLGILGGAVLTLMKIVEIVIGVFLKPTLEVRLTKEIFFRVINEGESLFANAVLLARHGSIEVRSVEFKLTKIGESIKDYPLKPLYFGEKVRGVSPFADHNFYTTSPIAFIPENIPQRIVYLNVVSSYAEHVKSIHQKLEADILNLKKEMDKLIPLEMNRDGTKIPNEILKRAIAIAEKSAGKVFDLIQLEVGSYTLKLTIKYWATSKVKQASETVESQIGFDVEDAVRDNYRDRIIDTLKKWSENILLGKNTPIILPEYNPRNVKEL